MALSQWLRRWAPTENRDESEGKKPLVSEREEAERPSKTEHSAADVHSPSQPEEPEVPSSKEETPDDKVNDRQTDWVLDMEA